MPFKDVEKKRTYKREWARRKRHGLTTRTKPILRPDQRKKQIKQAGERYRAKKRKMLEDAFGKQCFFCNISYTTLMKIHRKDGTNHKELPQMGLKELKREIEANRDKYVLLCGLCHRSVHWCMKYLGMTWEDILLLAFKQ